MAENLLYYLSKEKPDDELEFILATPKPEETIERLSEAANLTASNTKLKAISPKVIAAPVFSRFFSTLSGIGVKNILDKEAQSADIVIVLGGDDFTEDYEPLAVIRALFKLRIFMQNGKRVFLCGQSIGPFRSWRIPVVRHLLNDVAEITARDPITFEYLKNDFGLKNVKLFADLAFLPLAKEDYTSRYSIDGDYITLVPSELLWHYALVKDRFRYIEFLANVSARLLEQNPNHKLLILPHVLGPDAYDDRLCGKDLTIALKQKGIKSDRFIFIDDVLLPYQARNLLKNSYFVVTGRMHAAISSIASGVPFLALSYSRKYWGIIGEYLGFTDLIVDVRHNKWDEFEHQTFKAIDNIAKDYNVIKKAIADKKPFMSDRALESIRYLAKMF